MVDFLFEYVLLNTYCTMYLLLHYFDVEYLTSWNHISKVFWESNHAFGEVNFVISHSRETMVKLTNTFNMYAYNMLIRTSWYIHQHESGCHSLGKWKANILNHFHIKDSNDSFQSVVFINFLWIGPLSTAVVCYLIWLEVGISAVPSYVLMFIWIVIQGFFGHLSGAMRSVLYFIYFYFIII